MKDESDRFGLPAFTMLGASWAGACAVAARTCARTDALDPAMLRRLLTETGVQVRLYTAAAGNHGRAVARTARLLGASARVWTPASTPAHLVSAIEAEGAELVVVPGGYDDAVREAAVAAAADDRAALAQDTAPDPQHDAAARDGDLAARVVEGYSTLFHEIRAELGRDPDVLVVPVGVGSPAQAAATYCGAALLTVEPTSTACLLTALRTGSPRTLPAGTTQLAALNAGSLSGAARPVLQERVAAAVTVTDEAALGAAQELHLAGVAAGPCGGAALAGPAEALAEPDVRAGLGVHAGSCVVVLSTDGGPVS